MSRARLIIPLLLFLAIAGLFFFGLHRDPSEVPSPFIGRAAPAFMLPRLEAPDLTFSPASMLGKPWLLNVWASWCVACREEHPYLIELSKRGVVFVGMNYKDKRDSAIHWLDSLGNPYLLSISDSDGKVGIDYGVYGAPETFVIDPQGIIRFKHIGPITPEVWSDKIEPLLRRLAS